MAAELVSTIRLGQARWRDRMLVDLGVQRGLITAAQSDHLLSTLAADLAADSAANDVVSHLVQTGLLSASQLESLTSEFSVMDVMETVADASAPPEVVAANAKPGQRLGRYTLVTEIGAGGMGVVWRGWDNQLSRWVAVKQLKVKESQLVARFMREASMLAQLSHPNITTVHEVGVHQGQPYLVMELVEGGSPTASELSRKQAAMVVRDAANAVAYAHEQGIVHRDLKPSNLLTNTKGRVFVTDFGLARMKEEGASLTASGAIMGTPSFMAPEQAQGKEADYRTDVYGLGATLFALVEGRPPYSGEIVHEIVKRVAVSNPPSIEGDDDLVVVALKAMERDREDRYQSALALAEELDRYVRDEPITARKISSVERIWRRAKRKPALASSIAAATLLALSIASWTGTELYRYYERSAAVTLASAPLANAEAVSSELRKLYANDESDPEWIGDGLADLEVYTAAALAAAPGYSRAEYLRGMYHLWNGDYRQAHAHLRAALQDDPADHSARAYRAVVSYAMSDAASPSVTQDWQGFRVVPPAPSPSRDALVTAIAADINLLPQDFGLRILGESILASARGDFVAAVQLLSQHLERHKYDQRVRGILLWSLLAAGDFDATLEVAAKMGASGGYQASTKAVMAFALAGKGQTEAAIKAMQESIEIKPDADNEHWIAHWDFTLQNYEPSLERYTALLKDNPNQLSALIGRANALLVLASTDTTDPLLLQARSDLEHALAIDPNDPQIHFLLAQSLLQSDPAGAADSYRNALKLDREYYAGHGNAMLAAALVQLGDYPLAIRHLQLSLEAEPGRKRPVGLLARVHLLDGNPDTALQVLERYPTSADNLLIAASAWALKADYARALTLAEQASELMPKQTYYLIQVGHYAAQAEDFTRAKSAYAEAERLIPVDGEDSKASLADLLASHLYAWWMADQAELGITAAQRLAKLRDLDAAEYSKYASLLRLDQKPDQALEVIGKAIALEPQLLSHQVFAADLLLQLGRVNQANASLPLLAEGAADSVLRGYLLVNLRRCQEAREILKHASDEPGGPELRDHLQAHCGI